MYSPKQDFGSDTTTGLLSQNTTQDTYVMQYLINSGANAYVIRRTEVAMQKD
ncbi:MAG: hypothetical protein AAFU80_11125 [Pseudomonadota bacterium]